MSFAAPLPAWQRGADNVGHWAAILIGFALPISVAADNILLGVALLAWLAGGQWRAKLAAVRANPVLIATLALYAMMLIGATYGLGSEAERLRYLGKYADLLWMLPLAWFFADERSARRALAAFVAANLLVLALSAGIALEALPAAWFPERTPDNPVVFKLHITHGYFMAFAAYLLALAACESAGTRGRAALLGGALLCAANVLLMVQGRTGYAVVLALGALLVLLRLPLRWAVGGVAALAITAGTALQFSAPLQERVSTAVAEFEAWQPRVGSPTSIGLRLDYYSNALAIATERPLLGAGIGGFETAYDAQVAGTPMARSNNPHNQFLLIAAQLGFVGLAVFLALLAVQLRSAWRQPPPWRDIGIGLVAAMAVGSLFNSFLLDHAEGLFFVWMSALAFGRLSRARRA